MMRKQRSVRVFFLASMTTPFGLPNHGAYAEPGTKLQPFRLVSSASDLNVLSWDQSVIKQAAIERRPLTAERFPLVTGELVDLEIEPFQITSPDTQFVIRRKGKPDLPLDFDPSSVLLFRGHVKDKPGSHVFLSLRDNGSAGYIDLGSGAPRQLISSKGRDGKPLATGRLSVFEPHQTMDLPPGVPLCGAEDEHFKRMEAAIAGRVASMAPTGKAASTTTSTVGMVHHELAVETDYEYFFLFGDATEATAYLIQMYGAVSDIYMRDVKTHIEVVYTGIWTDPDDEYNGPDPLTEFYTYWENHMGAVQRDAAQLFSGRRNYPFGGQAFLAQLCNFAYGVVGYAVGFFPDPSKPHPFNYDVQVTAHELGHNFAAPHTHGIGIDTCDDATGAPQRGSIMSYCSQTWTGMNANSDNYFHTLIRAEMIPHINASSSCMPDDCNLNNIDDALDISGGASDDLNTNGVPDECEDCNENGVLDPTDIAGASDDENANGIPDECEPDCNNNGRPDDRDILLGTSTDAYGDGIPDECEQDCNGNGISDYTEIQLNMPLDVDRNATLDACQNCDGDGLTDHQELDGAHYLWIAEGLSGSTVRQFFPSTGVLTNETDLGIDSIVFEGQDVIVSPDGYVLVSSAGNDRVLEYERDGSFRRVLVSAGAGGLDYPTGLLISSTGTLLVSSRNTDAVLEYDLATGSFIGMFVSTGSGGLDAPFGLTYDRNGNLLVTSATNEILRYHGTTGASLGKFVLASGNGGLDQPRGMTFKPDGNLLVASYGTDEVLEFDRNGAPLGKWAQVGTSDRLTQDSPWGIRIGPNGHVFVSRTGTDHSSGGGASHHVDAPSGNVGNLHLTDARMYEFDVCTGLFRRTHIGGNDHGLDFATGFAFYPGRDIDCNWNQIQDDCDIASGASEDTNANGIPDECEVDCNSNGTQDELDLIPFGSSYDCNCNFTPDECDISSGASQDCDGNNVPDECEDCNRNGLADACDISNGTSDDCNNNDLPDDCEPDTDCNNNGTADICDLFEGTAEDCNENGVPDICDAAGGGLILDVDFESGLPAGWTTTGIFQVTSACTVMPVCDGSTWAYAGNTGSCSYGNNQVGELISPPIALPATVAELSFCHLVDTEAGYDFVEVFINSDRVLQEAGEFGVWENRNIDLTPYGGQTITITFRLASDSFVSGTLGWQVDNIRIVAGSEDCDGNNIPDECDPDCDGDGVPDVCDGSSECVCPATSTPLPETTVITKNRCLTIVPTNAGVQTALRVNLADVPAPLNGLNGTRLWIGNPRAVTEASDNSGDTPPPTFTTAGLQATPDCRDWAAVGSIDVMDDGIIPGARIEVQAINCVCDTGPSGNYSAALDVRMSIWGDVVGNNFDSLLPGRWDPPQGVIDFNDISSVVDKFRNLPGAPLKARVDISPNVPDLVIDFVDISRCVDAFRGDAYPFAGPSARGPLNEAPDAR